MNLTKGQIYEKVANQEITTDAAWEMIANWNEPSQLVLTGTYQATQQGKEITVNTEGSDFSQLQRRLEQYITGGIGDLLQIPAQELDKEDNFMDLGVDSTQLVQLTQQFEKSFGIELYPTLFFEYQNIKDLAEYLSKEHTSVFAQHFNLYKGEASPAPVVEAPMVETQSVSKISKPTDKKPLMGEKEIKQQNAKPDQIAVIGMAGVFADSPNLDAFWKNLRENKNLIQEIPTDHFDYQPWFDLDSKASDKMYCKWGSFIDDVAGFDARFFNISDREAELMDPQLRLLLQVFYTCAEDAGYPHRIRGTKTGMYVGVCFHDYAQEMVRQRKPIAPHDGTGNAATMMANRPSFYFNLTGPSLVVDTACSSSLVALHLACKALQHNECEMAFAAGTNLLLTSSHYRYFCSLGVLSYTGRCHTFDKRADGYVPGEGVGAVLLKPLAKAIADGDQIHAIIKGSAINHGGYTPSITAPSANLEAQVILEAWNDAQLDPQTLGYIEAHGTGTQLGDPVEINGLKKAFKKYTKKDKFCAVGSAKAHIGHTEGAAGIAGVIKVILSMKNKEIPAMPMLNELNPYIQLDGTPLYINLEVERWEPFNGIPRRAGVSSFGFGGTYGHVVLEEYEDQVEVAARPQTQEPQLIVLSAKNADRLKVHAQQLVDFLVEKPLVTDFSLTELAYTLQVGREAMEERLALVANSVDELLDKLTEYVHGQTEIEYCYWGNVKTSKTQSELLVEGDEGRDFVNSILNNKKLSKLALLWVSGIEIDWSLLYSSPTPQRISLPTYPFARERYWISTTSQPVWSGKMPGLHPLIDRIDPKLSLTQGVVFQKTLKKTDLIVKDHQVHLQPILPGVGYLEMAYAAGSFVKEETQLKLARVVWLQPVAVLAEKKEVQIVITDNGEQLTYHIQSQEGLHATGEIRPATNVPELRFDIEEIKARCSHVLTKETLYNSFQDSGIQYGSYFQGLSDVWGNAFEALGRLELPEAFEPELQYYTLHPTLMDGALQTIAGLSSGQFSSEGQLFLPFSISEVEIIRPLSASMYAYVKVIKPQIFNVFLLDETGLVCVKLQEFSLKASTHALEKIGLERQGQIEPDKVQTKELSPVSFKASADVTITPSAHQTPRTTSPAVLKKKVRQSIGDTMVECVSKSLGMDAKKIELERSFSEYGVDSIIGIELINKINDVLGITLRTTALFDYANVKALSDYIYDEYGLKISESVGTENTNQRVTSDDIFQHQQSAAPFKPEALAITEPVTQAPDANPILVSEKSHESPYKAVVLTKPGQISDIAMQPINPIEPNNREVQILVKAFSLNFGDLLCVKGLYPTMPEYPFTPGFEVSGVVQKTGRDVTRFQVGDEVIGLLGSNMGGHSHLVNTDERLVVKKPKNVTHEQAGAFPVVFLSMYHVFEQAKVKPGEKILIQTAAGGTGLVAVQLAQLKGAEIYATAGSPEKLDYLRKIGVYHLINYQEEDFAQKVLELTQDYGVDIIINTLSGEAIQKGIDILAPGGRYIEIAMTGLKTSNRFDLSKMVDNQTFQSVDLRKIMLRQPSIVTNYLDMMVQFLETGKIKPLVGMSFPFSQIQQAYQYLADRRNIGKVVVTNQFATMSQPHKTKALVSQQQMSSSPETFSGQDSLEIAIIGISGRFPGAKNVDEFWQNLSGGKSSIIEIPKARWDMTKYYDPDPQKLDKTYCKWGGFLSDIDKFDPVFFNMSGKEAEFSDPQQRLFLEESWVALEDAGYATQAISNKRCGVFVGVAEGDYHRLIDESGIEREAQSFWGNANSILAARISYFFNLKGPSIAIDTACSSSLVAIHLGCQSILTGESDMVVAGGVFVCTTPNFHILSSNAEMLSEDGQCKTFDNAANGFVPGEGVGVVILKLLKAALQDGDHIYGVIKGSGINQDGKTNGITAPSTLSQTELELSVYKKSGIHPETISYVETHGTGTKLGDPIEIEALTNAFKKYTQEKQYCAVGSVKTNIGHAATAAGIASVIKVLLALKYQQMPPSLNFNQENKHINFTDSPFYVNTRLKEWQTDSKRTSRRAAISSFGFSGTNAHIVLEEYENRPSLLSTQVPQLIVLSAKNEARLQAYAKKIISFLNSVAQYLFDNAGEPVRESTTSLKANLSLVDLAYTLQVGREAMEERLAIVASSVDDLLDKLTQYVQGETDIEDFYRGNVKTSKTEYGLLMKGKAGEAFLKAVIEEKELSQLASVWISGVEIDWPLLYGNHRPQRISLPTYPFARERYWISTTSQQVWSGKMPGLHPLIDRVDPKLSLTQGVVFQKTLKKTDLIVKDHQVREKPILPGVGYLEMAMAAGHLVKGQIKLARVTWRQPLVVLFDSKEVQIVIQPEQSQLTYQIQSRDGESNQILTHATGEIHPFSTPPTQRVSIEEIKARCSHHIEKETLYNRFLDNGIDYGAYFQGVSEVWGNAFEALGRLELPAAFESELLHYTLHPTLMDSALQTIAGIATDLSSDKKLPLLPFAVEEVEMLQPLSAKMYAYVKADGPQRFQVAMLDETGLVCLKFHEFSLRALPEPIENFFYVPRFLTQERKTVRAETPTACQTILIVYPLNSLGLEKALAVCHPQDDKKLIQLGTTNQQLAECHWEVNTRDTLALERCLEPWDHIHIIYYLGGIQPGTIDIDDVDALEASQERGVLSLFRLIKALTQKGLTQQPLQLNVITNDVFKITSSDITKPFAASLYGLCKAMAKEYPQLTVRCLDISLKGLKENTSQETLKTLVSPILTEPDLKGEEVVVRDGKRYIRRLSAIQLPTVEQTPFKHQGVYLILGGAGGIGLSFSHHLAKTVQARLILLGRSQLTAFQLDTFKKIEAQGGEVLYIQADATDLSSMRQAIEKAKSRFGQINGVIHSAIVLKDKTIDNMDEETFRAATAPKVIGSVVLHRVFQQEPLDFMMFFSSAQSFFGNAGQSNYAAGCTFKDAFAHAIDTRYEYPVKIINWGYWGDVGVVATDEYRQRLAAVGIQSIEPAEGMAAIERILSFRVTQIMPIKASAHALENMGIDRQHQIELYPATIPSLFEALVSQIKPPLFETSQMEKAFDKLVEFGQQLLLDAFQRMGVFLHSGEHYETEKLAEQLNLVPTYVRLFEALLEILEQAGFVECTDASVVTTPVLDNPALRHNLTRLAEKRHDLVETYSADIAAHVRLLWVCLQAYPDILTGQIAATEIMFPHSSLELVEGIYKGNQSADYFNQLVVQSVQSYIQARLPLIKHHQKIKILEVGAGTGGTSTSVLEAIDTYPEHLSYMYTDISMGFTQYGQQHYGQRYPFVEFGILNVETSVKTQGYELGGFDVIIAANVLHATRNIHNTLSNIKALLKTHGCLILNEVTTKQTFATLTFGLLEGWWLFEDMAHRLNGSPLLSASMWEGKLSEKGFERVMSLGLPSQYGAQHIIIAESNGEIWHQTLASIHNKQHEVVESKKAAKTTVITRSTQNVPTPQAVTGHEDFSSFIEETIVKILSDTLKIEATQFDSDALYTKFGVDSILSLDIINRLNTTLAISLKNTDLFNYPSIRELVNHIVDDFGHAIDYQKESNMTPSDELFKTQSEWDNEDRSSQKGLQLPQEHTLDKPAIYPLSHGQQALWFLYQLAPDSVAYNIALTLRIRSTLEVSALQNTFQALVNRHPCLRTTLTMRDEQPLQTVHQYQTVHFEQIDVSTRTWDELNQQVVEAYQKPFDLEQGPLLRVNLWTRASNDHILLLTVHHIVFDGWSLWMLIEELGILYPVIKAGGQASLQPLKHSYANYVSWQPDMLASTQGEELWAYWQQQLAGELPVINLPIDYPRPPVQTYHGASVHFVLNDGLTQQLKAMAQSEEASLYMVLLAAYQILLYRYTGQQEILVGSATTGRTHHEWTKIVGYFVNQVVLRADLTGHLTFKAFLAQVRQTVLAALEHQDYPFSLLVERLQPNRDPSRSPLFQVSFAFQKSLQFEEIMDLFVPSETGTQLNLGGLELEPFEIDQQEGQFELSLNIMVTKNSLAGTFKYNTDLFEAATITRLVGHFQTLLEGIVANPLQRISEIPMLTKTEQHQLQMTWNNTETEYPTNRCIHQLFEAQVERTPNAIAVVFEDQSITYLQLNQKANQLAHYLQSLGVKPEVLVGICLARSVEMVIGLFGILKAGGAYVPLDPALPKARLAFMLENAQVSVLLTQSNLIGELPKTAQMVCLDAEADNFSQLSSENLSSDIRPENLAYVIYTSGSTGQPKGVMIEHLSVINLRLGLHQAIYTHHDNFQLRVSMNGALSFDTSVKQLIQLLQGHTLVIVPEEVRFNKEALLAYLQEHQINVFDCTPSHLNFFVSKKLLANTNSVLHSIIIGGEPLNDLTWQFLQQTEKTAFYNIYGPTECTVDATVCALSNAPVKPVIGRPIANTQIYILDCYQQSVPIGVSGELHIGGISLARGYLNRPDLTAEKFIPNPFSDSPNARLYKTGDLARYLPDGNIEYLGRIDNQVKIRGFRIELSEIEAMLGQHPGVRENAVIVHENSKTDKRLIAYWVPALGQVIENAELRDFLKQRLPDYMIPSAFVTLEALPLTPNHKLDRRTLSQLSVSFSAPAEQFVAPRTPSEALLADIWTKVLEVERVGIHDNFFELGGDSIISLQVVARANQAGLQLTPTQLIQHQTIAELAVVADCGLSSVAEQGLVTGRLPLTPIQHRFFEQKLPQAHHFNQAFLLKVSPKLTSEQLTLIVKHLLQHHDALRLRFSETQEPVITDDYSLAVDNSPLITLKDLSTCSPDEQHLIIETTAAQLQASLNFDSN